EAHKEGEPLWAVERLEAGGRVRIRHVVGHHRILTGCRLVALGLEELVRDTHLDVVRLAGEELQGLILRLPAEAGNSPIVAVAIRVPGDHIGPTADPEYRLLRGVYIQVGANRVVWDHLDQ